MVTLQVGSYRCLPVHVSTRTPSPDPHSIGQHTDQGCECEGRGQITDLPHCPDHKEQGLPGSD